MIRDRAANGWRIVGAVDLDRNRRGRGTAFAVGQRIRVGVCDCLAFTEVLYIATGIVDRIDVTSIAVDDDTAIGAAERHAHISSDAFDGGHGQVVIVRIGVSAVAIVIGNDIATIGQ